MTMPAACTPKLRDRPSSRVAWSHSCRVAGSVSIARRSSGFAGRGIRERDVLLPRSGRNHVREPIRIAVGKPDDAPDVAHGALRVHFVEGDDLRDAAVAVFLPNVFEHFAPPLLAEIDVDIGRRNAFRIQEPLEEQPELQRIDVGDPEHVSRPASRPPNRARARPESRAASRNG